MHLTHYFTNNEGLKSNIQVIKYVKNDISFLFNVDIGVFSNKKLDYGSTFLIDTFLKLKKKIIKTF
jgi:16S rRNA G1207 methylase RsmC